MALRSEPAEKDIWVHCPYNHEHHMPQSRLQWHLVKCPEKRTREHLFTTCPYNSIHIIPKCELGSHIAKCKDKKLNSRNFQNENPIDSEIKKYLATAGKPKWNSNDGWQAETRAPVGYTEQSVEKPVSWGTQNPAWAAQPNKPQRGQKGNPSGVADEEQLREKLRIIEELEYLEAKGDELTTEQRKLVEQKHIIAQKLGQNKRSL